MREVGRNPDTQKGIRVKKMNAQTRYQKKALRRYALNVNRNTEVEILNRLESKKNVQGYLKDLILRDIKNDSQQGS